MSEARSWGAQKSIFFDYIRLVAFKKLCYDPKKNDDQRLPTLKKKYGLPLSLVLFTFFFSGCASQSPQTPPPPASDPYQGFNQSMFRFNDHVYTYVSHPLNTAYTTVTPKVARTGVANVFRNIGTIPDMANDALQGNWRYFVKDTLRLLLNTTLGLFGLFDVASPSGLPLHQQGFTYTLAKWGYDQSNYLVLPFFGPSTVSGALSILPDYLMSPINHNLNEGKWKWPIAGLFFLNLNAQGVPRYEFLKKNALDPYSAMRDAYLQNRAFVIQQIKTDGASTADNPADHQSEAKTPPLDAMPLGSTQSL